MKGSADEGSALVMVFNGLRVTTVYTYKSMCVCVNSAVVSPLASNHVHLVSGNKWPSLSLNGPANVSRLTMQYF